MANKYVPIFFDWRETTVDLNQEQKGNLIDAVVEWAITGQDPDFVLNKFSKKQSEIYEQIKQDFLLFTSFPNGRAMGKFHGNWKGGISSSTQRDRNTVKAIQWRQKVFSRDRFSCQICGKVGGNLNAHHIMPWADYPELRYQVSNGITLCEMCHRAVHKGVTQYEP